METAAKQHPTIEIGSGREERVPRPGEIVTVKGVGGPLLVEAVTLDGENMILTAVDSEDCHIQFRGPQSHYSIEVHEPDTPLGPCGHC